MRAILCRGEQPHGSLDGTWTLARQRPDGVNVVAFFNQRSDASKLPYDAIKAELDAAVDQVTVWPK